MVLLTSASEKELEMLQNGYCRGVGLDIHHTSLQENVPQRAEYKDEPMLHCTPVIIRDTTATDVAWMRAALFPRKDIVPAPSRMKLGDR